MSIAENRREGHQKQRLFLGNEADERRRREGKAHGNGSNALPTKLMGVDTFQKHGFHQLKHIHLGTSSELEKEDKRVFGFCNKEIMEL